MKNNPIFKKNVPQAAHGYQGFPMDNLLNMTSVAGYLLPVYWDFLDPGDKVTCRTLLRTKTVPFAAPAMATIIERLEWFAVPIAQLYKPFSAKFYGISDVESDLLPTNGYNTNLPFIQLDELDTYIKGCATNFNQQAATPGTAPTLAEVKRLCDCIGVPKSVGGAGSGVIHKGSISALPFAAYQKIYMDHYRLSDREFNDVAAYNLDSYSGTTSVPAKVALTSPATRFDKLFMLRKRPYMRDYFTSMQVSPLLGSSDTSASQSDLGKLNQWLTGLSAVGTGTPGSAVTTLPAGGNVSATTSLPTTTRQIYSGSPTGTNVLTTITPANIRSLYAVEKLLEVTRAAKKHYDMQTLAHFGVDVPKGLSGECFKLGTKEQLIKIGEVLSTNDSATVELGARAGLGNSETPEEVYKDSVEFEAKAHCVLMCIYSAEPVVNVVNEGCPRILSKVEAHDFYKSEFDNLGMQPVFRKELMCDAVASTDDSPNTVIGWNYRYYEDKATYNRSIAGVANNMTGWALNRSSIGQPGGLIPSGISNNFFSVWPTDLNGILNSGFVGTHTSIATVYDEDYFVNQIYFDVQKATKKSIYGVPNL